MRDADRAHAASLRDDTAGRLVAAAEQLFAEGGEEATSLRAISRAARSNAAAVHYHFGGRDELLRAVAERHLLPLNGARFALLDEAVRWHGAPVPVDAIVLALVRPDFDLLARLRPDRVRVARLLGRAAMSSGSAVAESMRRQFDALAARVVPMLSAALPEVPTGELHLRLRLVRATVAAMLAAAGDPEATTTTTATATAGDTGDALADEDRLVAFCAAGLAAPPTPARRTTQKKRKKHA